MIEAIRQLLGSKKAITTIVGLVVAAGAHFGAQVSEPLVIGILGLFAILVGAQGSADFGKAAAAVKPEPSPPSGGTQAILSTLLMVGCAMVTGSVVVACTSATRQVAANAVTAEANCIAPSVAEAIADFGDAAVKFVAGKISGDRASFDDDAIRASLRRVKSLSWSCAVTEALAALLAGPTVRTAFAPPPGPDPEVVRATIDVVKAELGVAVVKTSAGVL